MEGGKHANSTKELRYPWPRCQTCILLLVARTSIAPEMFELSQSVGSSRIIRLRNQNVPRAHETKCKMRRRCSQTHSFYVTSISPS